MKDEDRVIKDREKARRRTMDRAVRLLAAKPRPLAELRERLLEKSWTDAEIVDAVIEKLREYGYVDDEKFARDLAASKLRQKPLGRRKLEQILTQKKLGQDEIDAAVEAAYAAATESELIDDAIARRVATRGIPADRRELNRLYAHLMGRGFPYGLIRDRLKDLQDGTAIPPSDEDEAAETD